MVARESQGNRARARRNFCQRSGSNGRGLAFHIAFTSDDKFRVSEVWDSREQFDAFGERLMPVLKDVGVGLSGEPEMLEIHNILQR